MCVCDSRQELNERTVFSGGSVHSQFNERRGRAQSQSGLGQSHVRQVLPVDLDYDVTCNGK